MSKPEHIKRWWGNLGDGYSVPVCEVDLRVGGKWRFVNRHPKGDAEFYGVYREINPPDRVVFTEIYAPFPDAESVVTAVLHRGERQDAPERDLDAIRRKRCATWCSAPEWKRARRSATTASTKWRVLDRAEGLRAADREVGAAPGSPEWIQSFLRVKSVFLLSPAYCGGRRASILLNPKSEAATTREMRAGRLSLGPCVRVHERLVLSRQAELRRALRRGARHHADARAAASRPAVHARAAARVRGRRRQPRQSGIPHRRSNGMRSRWRLASAGRRGSFFSAAWRAEIRGCVAADPRRSAALSRSRSSGAAT